MSGNYPASGERNPAMLVQSIQDLFSGRNNCFGEFTLAADPATSTTVRSPNSGPQSIPLLVPLTANAAAAYAAGDLYISARGAGEFTVTHGATANEDCTFGYVALG